MSDVRRFQHQVSSPSSENLKKTCWAIEGNLQDMKQIVSELLTFYPLSSESDKRTVLYIGCCLYDFYLLVEDCFLHIARLTDCWIPGSLDWHYRLIRLMRQPVPETRPPVLSSVTAELLDEYLILFLNYHRHSPTLTAAKIEKMVGNLAPLIERLEKELSFLNRLSLPGKR